MLDQLIAKFKGRQYDLETSQRVRGICYHKVRCSAVPICKAPKTLFTIMLRRAVAIGVVSSSDINAFCSSLNQSGRKRPKAEAASLAWEGNSWDK